MKIQEYANAQNEVEESIKQMLDELIEMTKGETSRLFDGKMRKYYRYLLCCTFCDILTYGNPYVERHAASANAMWKFPEFHQNHKGPQNGLDLMIDHMQTHLRQFDFKNVESDKTVLDIVAFFRTWSQDYKGKQKTLYLASDLEDFLDVKMFLLRKGAVLKTHHWVDINLQHGMTSTHPEFFNYQDLIHMWNDFVRKVEEYSPDKDMDKEERRALIYSISSSYRTTLICAVTFVESYLYYYYYNMKHDSDAQKNPDIQGILNYSGNIQDTRIVEKLIFKLHPSIKEDQTIRDLYQSYKKINNLRNRYIHTSAFVDENSQLSDLQPLLQLNVMELIESLQCCVDFVFGIDKMLPLDEKILFWSSRFEYPDFRKQQYINPLNIWK